MALGHVSSFITIGLLGLAAWGAGGSTRVFVQPFASKSGAPELRSELLKLLSKEPGVAIAGDPSSADFIVSGSGETYVKGYFGTNPRVRYLNSDAKPVYGGFLSVELKTPDGETVWSYLVTPRRFGPEDINQNLAGQMVRKLMEQVQAQRKAQHP